MSFELAIDVFGNAGNTLRTAVEQGAFVFVEGWAGDVAGGEFARSYGLIDSKWRVSSIPIPRLDVAQHFGRARLVDSGFDLSFSTEFIELGQHSFEIVAELANGEKRTSPILEFEVVAPKATLTNLPRILLVSSPKSGSTYTCAVLQEYFNVGKVPLYALLQGWQEDHLDMKAMERLRNRAFVLHTHMRPSRTNLDLLERENIRSIVTWRNLADTVVSLDEHILREDEARGGMNFRADRQAAYASLAQQERYKYLIRFQIPNYVSFYMGCRELGLPIFRYENLATNPVQYFTDIVETTSQKIDADRLQAIIQQGATFEKHNKAVGIPGRSVEKFSVETRAMLEDLLRSHFRSVEDLLYELPWRQNSVRSETC